MIQLGLTERAGKGTGPSFEVLIPIRTKTGLNSREHFAVRAKRVKRERQATRLFWRLACLIHPVLRRPLTITLIRISPGNGADLDNVVGGLKGIRDQVAEQLGIDDGDQRAVSVWRYDQEKGPWGVRVRVEGGKPFLAKPGEVPPDGLCPKCVKEREAETKKTKDGKVDGT